MSTFNKIILGLVVYVAGFAALEAVLRIMPSQQKEQKLFSVETISSLKKKSWYSEWKEEQSQLKRTFQAYEIFRLDSFQGKHIMVGPKGYRRTVNSPLTGEEGAKEQKRVALLGGSVVWGSWSRDPHTIASELSQRLAQSEVSAPVDVNNFGEIGFVFSQALHRAYRVLYSPDGPPNYMVFFLGAGDMGAAVDNWAKGVDLPAGLPWEVQKFRYLFKLGNTGEITFTDVAKKSEVFRASLRLFERLGLKKRAEKGFWRDPTEADLEVIGQQVAEQLVAMVRTGHATLSAAGVTPIFVFSPSFFGKHPLTAEEQGTFEKNEQWKQYFEGTHQKVMKLAAGLPSGIRFYDWYSLFWDDEQTRFIDLFHYTESANQKIAEKLGDTLTPLLKPKRKQRLGKGAKA